MILVASRHLTFLLPYIRISHLFGQEKRQFRRRSGTAHPRGIGAICWLPIGGGQRPSGEYGVPIHPGGAWASAGERQDLRSLWRRPSGTMVPSP